VPTARFAGSRPAAAAGADLSVGARPHAPLEGWLSAAAVAARPAAENFQTRARRVRTALNRKERSRGNFSLRSLVRKEGLEPSRCYPQVPETCASTSSATFAGRGRIAASPGRRNRRRSRGGRTGPPGGWRADALIRSSQSPGPVTLMTALSE
jgi:hypothetical protein